MPGLLRGVARTAVIAGTATATANAVNRRQASKNAAAYNEAEAPYQEQAAPAPAPAVAQPSPAPAPAAGQDDKLSQLERLGQLKAQGILNDQEFEQQKAQILAE